MVNSVHIYSQILTDVLNDCAESGNVLDMLKYAGKTPDF